ncbi:metallophosphoesterase domain-containing protein [Morchella snyderi]|nr:metallophosphoesterase domain-containing protein [Morchella snyderi]
MSGAEAFLISGPAPRKKLRVVCVSDTHNSSPKDGVFKVPPGDVLIHAGDMTNQGSYSELKKVADWISDCPHEVKLVIAGNHDGVTLDPEFLKEFGDHFHNQAPQSHAGNLALFISPEAVAKGIVYLNHEFKTITLKDGRTFNVFGSPWSPKCGLWGFGYSEAPNLQSSMWKGIPLDTDIMITHGPPKCHLDGSMNSSGCEHLRQAVWAVRPLLHVFGHIHQSRGVERVRWDLKSKFVKYKEESVTAVEDPNPDSAKQFVVDLTEKSRNALDNDGTLEGRNETCLVNAAMVTRPWKKGTKHSVRNKAVVVDVNVLVVEKLGQAGDSKHGEDIEIDATTALNKDDNTGDDFSC